VRIVWQSFSLVSVELSIHHQRLVWEWWQNNEGFLKTKSISWQFNNYWQSAIRTVCLRRWRLVLTVVQPAADKMSVDSTSRGFSAIAERLVLYVLQSIAISLSTDLTMLRKGSDSATATVEIWSIGVFDAERNVQYTKDIFHFITDTLQLPPDR